MILVVLRKGALMLVLSRTYVILLTRKLLKSFLRRNKKLLWIDTLHSVNWSFNAFPSALSSIAFKLIFLVFLNGFILLGTKTTRWFELIIWNWWCWSVLSWSWMLVFIDQLASLTFRIFPLNYSRPALLALFNS